MSLTVVHLQSGFDFYFCRKLQKGKISQKIDGVPRDVLDEILNLIESVSEDFPSYSYSSYSLHII